MLAISKDEDFGILAFIINANGLCQLRKQVSQLSSIATCNWFSWPSRSFVNIPIKIERTVKNITISVKKINHAKKIKHEI